MKYIGIKVTIPIIHLLILILKITGQGISLIPRSPAIVIEGKYLKFTCQSNLNNISFYVFSYTENNEKKSAGKAITSSELCQNENQFINISCNFASKTFVLTFLNPVHNQTVYCEAIFNRTTYGSNSTIFVQVPVSEVILSPKGKIEVNETTETTFSCLARRSRPISNITWYRKNGVVSETSSTIQSNGSIFDVKSKLTTSFPRGVNGSILYCTASNIGGIIPKKSEEAVISVIYAPSRKPDLTVKSVLPVNEDHTVTLQCILDDMGNPPILWSWMCGDDNLTNEAKNTGTQSTLTFTANRKHDNRTCQCWATSPKPELSYRMSSQPKIISVYYRPFYAPKMNTDTSLPFDEGELITLMCSVDTLGNPSIRWSWICGGDNLTNEANTAFLQSILKFTANRKYNQKTCKCWAASPRLSLSYNMSSEPRTINVYFAVNITKVWILEGSNNMTAGFPLRIKAEFDGNPNSTVVWKIKQPNEIILQEEFSVSNCSEFRLGKITCLHTNDYTVTANNGVGNMSLKQFSLNVLCPPYLSIDNDPEPVVVGDEKQFVIKRNFIANPKPTVVWEKIEGSEVSTIKNRSQHVTILNFSNGIVNYTTILERKNVTMPDIGLYNLYLENGLGNYSSITQVIFKRRPDIPSNLSVSCNEPFQARLSWIAEFDGGGNQSFLVAFSQIDWNSENISPVSTSGERGENKIVTINDLQPNIEHAFKIYAKNRYGNVSTKSVSCKIKDANGEDPLPLITSTAAISSLVIIVIIITTILLYRRRGIAFKKARNSSIRLNNDNENEEDDPNIDGLKENSLYVSAGPKDDERSEVAVYAAVAKKQSQSDNSSNLYADVKKSGGKEKKTLSSDDKTKKGLFKKDEKAKHKKGKKPKNRPGEIDVYENSEDIALSTNTENVYSNAGQKGPNKQKERGYKNKDGLLYVEVNFDGKQGHDNPVIHGEDEKTDYATVEFPMPSSVHKASGGEEL